MSSLRLIVSISLFAFVAVNAQVSFFIGKKRMASFLVGIGRKLFGLV
jgi:hypothetical protein